MKADVPDSPSRLSSAISKTSLLTTLWLFSVWLLVRVVERADWGKGLGEVRALASLSLALTVTALFVWSEFRARSTATASSAATAAKAAKAASDFASHGLIRNGLLWLAVIFFSWHCGRLLNSLQEPRINDVAGTTLQAARLLVHGKNPYAAAIDQVAIHGSGSRYGGFKYGPLMLAAYLPAVAWPEPLDQSVLLLINFVMDLLVIGLVYHLARQIAGELAGKVAAVFFISLPIVPSELFGPGVTDFAAILPLLFAFMLPTRAFGRGLLMGASASVKILPALLLLPIFAPQLLNRFSRVQASGRRRAWPFFAGLTLGLLPMLGFYLWAPSALIDNVFLFNLQRGVDGSSWSYGASADVRLWAKLTFVLCFSSAGFYLLCWRQLTASQWQILVALTTIILFEISGPINHRNYQLWWLPLLSILVGVIATRLSTSLVSESMPAN